MLRCAVFVAQAAAGSRSAGGLARPAAAARAILRGAAPPSPRGAPGTATFLPLPLFFGRRGVAARASVSGSGTPPSADDAAEARAVIAGIKQKARRRGGHRTVASP